MTKKEIAEIKKLYSIDRCAITRFAGCYVDGEKTIKTKFAENFLSLPEEIIHKYISILKKSLSGSVDKNLLTLEFLTEEEDAGGCQKELLKLRDSALRNDKMLDAFYQKFIEAYEYVGNYLILLFHNVYDVVGKANDNSTMEDASEEVYQYISCIICPVDCSKAELAFNPNTGKFENRVLDWVVGMPDVSFMFPAFNDRCSDIHSILYYEKKADLQHKEIVQNILGCNITLDAKEQQKIFNTIMEECGCSLTEVKDIHEKLSEVIEEHRDEPTNVVLGKESLKTLLQDVVSDGVLENFDTTYTKIAGSKAEFTADNLTDTKKMELKSPDIRIKVAPDKSELIKEKDINGLKCLVIEIGSEVEINGVKVTGK